MHCPPEIPSAHRSSCVLAIQKPKKTIYEGKIVGGGGKIHM